MSFLFISVVLPNARAADDCTTYFYNGDHHHDGNPPGNNNECGGGDHEEGILEVFTMGAGFDTVRGHGGADEIYGNSGNDHLMGGPGRDEVHLGDHADTGDGGDGDDFVYGAGGSFDVVLGGEGRDHVQDTVADQGDDSFCGNGGLDSYNTVDNTEESNNIYAQSKEADRIEKDPADQVNWDVGCVYS